MSDKITRRRLLTTSSAVGAGLLASGGLPAFAQQAAQPEQDLPVGSAGKLTVIHRTEYFEAAQTKFREVCQAFADGNNVTLDISTTNPEAFGDFLGKMGPRSRPAIRRTSPTPRTSRSSRWRCSDCLRT
jgi:multiple sugar transport system substrate-binding protein